MDLTQRVLEGELMDAPDIETQRHQAALRALERINRLSGTASVVSRAIVEHCGPLLPQNAPGHAPLRILDLACGGGDVTIAVGRKLSAAGMNVSIEAWDRSGTAIEFAKERMRAQSILGSPNAATGKTVLREIQFVERDVLELDTEAQFDVVMSTLFLHHLNRADTVALLSKMHRAARHLMLVDDLRRTWVGYRLAQVGCFFLTRSPVVHADGPQSVRAAFTEAEIEALSREAGLPRPAFFRHWPQRFLMRWNRST